MCHGIKRPGDLDLCSSDFALVCNARDNFPANAGVSVTYLKYIVEIVNEFCCLGDILSVDGDALSYYGLNTRKSDDMTS